MQGFKAFLNRKFFNLPVWAWAIIAAIVLMIAYRYFKNRSSGGSSGGSSLPDTSAATPADGSGGAGNVSTPVGEPPIDNSGTVGSIPEAQFISDLSAALQSQMPQGDLGSLQPGDRTPNPDIPVWNGIGIPEKPPSGGGPPKPKKQPPRNKKPIKHPKKSHPPHKKAIPPHAVEPPKKRKVKR